MALAICDNFTHRGISSSLPSSSPSSSPTVAESPPVLGPSFYDLLHNYIVLRHIAPYLSVDNLLSLAATNRAFRHLILKTPGVFRHLDLSRVRRLQPDYLKRVQQDGGITRNRNYSAILSHGFSKLGRVIALGHIQTLILDGLYVAAELCHDIITGPAFNVRTLSIRNVLNLDEQKLMETLKYACRPSRPKGTPKLQALYVHGIQAQSDLLLAPTIDSNVGSDPWWENRGRAIPRVISRDWAHCMLACQGIIAFDAVLCRGPRHRNSPLFVAHDLDTGLTHTNSDDDSSNPAVATYGLAACDACGDAPEGMIHARSGPIHDRPLLSPPPLHSSLPRAASAPQSRTTSMVARCLDCIRDRFCTTCAKWWCESCYSVPGTDLALAAAAAAAFATEGGLFFDDDDDDNDADDDDNDSGSWNSALELDSSSGMSSPSIKVRKGFCQPCGAKTARFIRAYLANSGRARA